MKTAIRTRLLLGAPGLALAAGAITVALESPNADRVLNAAMAGLGVLLIWSVAVAVRLRYPERPLGLLLFGLAGAYATQTLVASHDSLLFTLARASRPAVEVLLVWVMLAFPTGRLRGWRERALVAASALAVVALWLPAVMFSSRIPMAGSFVQCQPQCPRNALFVADQPAASQALLLAFRGVAMVVLVATAALLFSRLRQATPLLRRALAPVLLASIARTLTVAFGILTNGLGFAATLTLWAVPLAIALGLLRGRLYMAKALQRLVTGLRGQPGVHELRDVMARALDDASLSIAYWLKDTERWVDAEGQVVALPYPSSARGRATTMVRDAEGRPVATLIHDVALLEVPALVEAVASSMQMALEGHRVEAELKVSRAHTATAVEEERHRIERDLHDGAQQRLIALRMKLGVTSRLLDHDPRRAAALVGEMGTDVDAAIVELRTLAHCIVPPLLVERGLADALAEAAQRAAIPVRTAIEEVGHCDPGIERAVYFCCLEALQNAAKHAGPGATARLTLRRAGDTLHFRVEDDGAGLAGPGHLAAGQGLANMRERIETVGGQLEIENRPGQGFRIVGTVPTQTGNSTCKGRK